MIPTTYLQLTDIDSRYNIYTVQNRSLFIKYPRERSLYKRHQDRTVATLDNTKTVRWRPQTGNQTIPRPYGGNVGRTTPRPYGGDLKWTIKRYQDRAVVISNELRVPSFGGCYYCEFFLLEETHTKAISNELRVPFVNSFGGFFTIKRTDSSCYIILYEGR